ncbi:MAG TPA: PilZ domain-containing protein [bacterium]|nr:PilZ domain-containing protein [bacterium]
MAADDKSPLSDLSFFRFPGLTAEVVRNIALLLLALALTVLVTVVLHRRVQHWMRNRRRRSQLDRFSSEHHMTPAVRAVLRKLMRYANATDEYAFIQDAEAFERAAERLVEEGDDATFGNLGRLRQALHLNVMNPEIALVSTRQLLADLPVRLIANIGEEKLDLYCALLDVNEDYLLIDLAPDEEIRSLLERNPRVFLLYWRERGGEAVFRLDLEPVGGGAFPALRARHAFRDSAAEHRNAFRLSVDLPCTYQFLERSELGRRLGRGGGMPSHKGDGRLLDLSYGGASLMVPEPLAERGLAQLSFEVHGQPMRLMLEVLSRAPMVDGHYLVRGQFRGLGEEARVRLNNLLNREQVKRVRDRELLRIRPGA